jgi:hypothetical protein
VVEVVIEVGKLPRLLVSEDARIKGEAYRALLESIRSAHTARFGRVFELKRNGAYLEVRDWLEFCEGQRFNKRIIEARELRTHSARNKKLNAILSDLSRVPSVMGVCA